MASSTPFTAKALVAVALIVVALAAGPASAQTVFFNDVNYDPGTTSNPQYFAIAGPAGTDLTGYAVYQYDASGNVQLSPQVFGARVVSDDQNGYGVEAFPASPALPDMQTGLALVDVGGTLVHFVSYEGAITAVDGPAAGTTSTNLGTDPGSSGGVDQSLQLTGTGNTFDDFTVAVQGVDFTPPPINANQAFQDPAVTVTADDASIAETGGSTTITVAITDTPPVETQVTLALDETAEASLSATTVTFEANTTDLTRTVTLSATDDTDPEGDQTVTVSIDALSTAYATIGTPSSAGVVVLDDDLATSASLDGTEGWRMLASPEATTVDGFLGDLWTQGFTGADTPAGGCNVFVYAEAADTFAEGWTCVADASEALAPGEGVMVYVFEDDDVETPGVQGGFPKTVSSSTAVVPPALFSFSVVFTDDARDPSQKGWNLLGVPHGASLDWGGVSRTNVGATVYVYDPAFNGGDYRTGTDTGGGSVTGDLPGGLIPPFQGFFVQADGTSPSLTASDAAADAATDVYGRRATPAAVRLALSDASGERSAAWVSLVDGAALSTDPLDAVRLEPTAWPRAVLFTTAVDGGTPLVFNALHHELEGATYADVPLDVAVDGEPGPLALTLTATAEGLPDGWTLTLVDRTTGIESPLTGGAPAALTVAGDPSNSATPDERTLPAGPAGPAAMARRGSARYALRVATSAFATSLPDEGALATVLGPVVPNPTSAAAALTWSLAEPGDARVSVVDLLGREVAVLAEGAHRAGAHRTAIPTDRLAPGVYLVRLVAGTSTETARFTVAR